MGKINGLYNEDFPVGTTVQIVERDQLIKFIKDWKSHHPFEETQLEFAGHITEITKISFYHGGDELYNLKDIPGVWHEVCLIRSYV